MKKKKKHNKKFILAIILLIIAFGFYLFFDNQNYFKLLLKGYKPETISILLDNFENKQINNIINAKYISDLDNYITSEDFIFENLSRYRSYKKNNDDLNYNRVITNVNIGLDQEAYLNTKNVEFNGYLTLVNKHLKLSQHYIPDNLEAIDKKYATNEDLKLVKEAKQNFEKMCEDALKENLTIVAYSAYRSYIYQTYTYNSYVRKKGEKLADTYSARPGHSEHQLGLAVDVTNKEKIKDDFQKTKEYDWLKDNSYRYGFILRYIENKEEIQQYIFEPWHYRYVGVKVATDIYNNYKDLTYDEYYYRYIKA